MKEILLTQGKVALVDDADFELLSAFKWYALKSKGTFYARRDIRRPDDGLTAIRMHNFLLPGASKIDHRDGNGLNNQRHNLRPATTAQNGRGFQSKRIGTSSTYRGVCWDSKGKKWRSDIKFSGRRVNLGRFASEITAARAYDSAAQKYFGEFASLNFPQPPQ